MSKKRKHHRLAESESKAEKPLPEPEAMPNQSWLLSIKRNWLMVLIISFLALGALGAGLKYLDEDAKREIARRNASKDNLNNQQESFLNRINPFLPDPTPTPTPQLSKELIYAGSRLLAVEDANANAAPPADLAVWRPSSGVWWVMGSSGSQQVTQSWGISGDVPVPGDYDGDSKTDFSVFRPSNSTWYIVNSSTGGTGQFPFGTLDDKAAQADYDGDGRTDAAIFRPSNTTWYILQSSTGNTVYQQFGLAADTPAPADYDGDGRADLGIWRDSTAVFYSLNSSTSALQAISYGQTGDVPVPGDYDGDGRADYALKRGNQWLIRQSSNGQTQIISWEQAGDKAVQNDYDGDGKSDVAVWRDANGTWYIRNSSNPSQPRIEQWGIAGDIPVPAFYRR